MDAIVTAGGIPQPGEPLYEYTRGQSKAMLEICGKPMIQWVLDALGPAQQVERVVIIGLSPDSGLTCARPLFWMPNQGDLLENVRAGVKKVLEINPAAHHTLLVSSDIPAITAEMVDWVVRTALESDHEFYYNVIRREAMEARFPGSRRTYTRLKDADLTGGDMNVVRTLTVTGNDALWQKIIASRKSPLKQAALIGYGTLILLLLRQLTTEDVARRVCQRLSIKGRVLLCPYAEIGMDVDKPHQLEIMRADLGKRVSG